jgi:GTP cyclohydrolase IA
VLVDLMEDSLEQIVSNLGLDLKDAEYKNTPRRAAQWYLSFARKPDYENDCDADFFETTFPSPYNEMVWESGLSFVSLCPHHLLPYSGTASIAYIPNGSVVGISKLARALEYYTHYPVKQEDATANLADSIMHNLHPLGCMVILRAFHTCMGLRGVKQPDHQTGTSAVRGCFADNTDNCRTEFLSLMHSPHHHSSG